LLLTIENATESMRVIRKRITDFDGLVTIDLVNAKLNWIHGRSIQMQHKTTVHTRRKNARCIMPDGWSRPPGYQQPYTY